MDSLHRLTSRVAVAVGIVLCASTLAGFFGALSWYLDLFSHFRVQYFAALALLSVLLLILGHPRIAAGLVLFAVVNLLTIVPFYLEPAASKNAGRPLRAVMLNVNTDLGDPRVTSRMLETLDPDIIALVEVNQWWLTELQDVLARYPHAKLAPRPRFGVALYSKLPLSHAETIDLGSVGVPSVVAEMATETDRVRFVVTHPLPPTSHEQWRARNQQLTELAQLARQSRSPVMVLGDLNITPWSPHFKRLLSAGRLQDSMRGYGMQPSWPTSLAPMLIPIDHCLHTEEIHITSRTIGPYVRSDHFPLIVEFTVGGD